MITPRTLKAEEEMLAALRFSHPQFVRLTAMNMVKISWKKKYKFIANVSYTKTMAFPPAETCLLKQVWRWRFGGFLMRGAEGTLSNRAPSPGPVSGAAGHRRHARFSQAAGATPAHRASRCGR